MSRKTTIQISLETKKKLCKLKIHPREPFDDVIKRLIREKEESKR